MNKKILPILLILLTPIINNCDKGNDNSSINEVADYDGNRYKTIQIGDQIWMAENLKTAHYANGVEIQLVESGLDWVALTYTDKAMCYYDNTAENKDTYGALYTWAAAVNGSFSSETNPGGVQGICPVGWHLPSDNEWKELEMYLGMSQHEADMFSFRGSNEGSKLAGESSLWDGPIVNENERLIDNADFGTSCFNALPGGYRTAYSNGLFSQSEDIAEFWCATESGDTLALIRLLHYYNTSVYRFTSSKKSGASVRCIKD